MNAIRLTRYGDSQADGKAEAALASSVVADFLHVSET